MPVNSMKSAIAEAKKHTIPVQAQHQLALGWRNHRGVQSPISGERHAVTNDQRIDEAEALDRPRDLFDLLF